MNESALTFDDITLIPQFSEVLPSEVDTAIQLTPTIRLETPVLSSAMDTVTESKMAIAMAQNGGLGVIHKNMSILDQSNQIRIVKRHSGGIVDNPVTVRPHHDIYHVKELIRDTGYSSFPVIMEPRWGMKDSVLIGMITSRDIKFERHDETLVEKVMTPIDNLTTASEGMERSRMVDLMYARKVERVPVVRMEGCTPILVGLFSLKDHNLKEMYPKATRDTSGRLCVAAAVGAYSPHNLERVDALVKAGVDAIVVDTAHGHSLGVIKMVEVIHSEFPSVSIIAGNVVTAEGASALFDAGAHSVKVGIGPGSICTTRIISGVGIPQYTAILNTSESVVRDDQTIICDGGVRYSGDIVKAMVAGANAVMLGGLLAGCDESPGDPENYMGRVYKTYRGMGSLGAMTQRYGSADRYRQDGVYADKLVPEGIEGRVPYSGSVDRVLTQLIGGLRSGMGYLGCKRIDELWQMNECVYQLTPSGLRESHPHNISIVREAPNYSANV